MNDQQSDIISKIHSNCLKEIVVRGKSNNGVYLMGFTGSGKSTLLNYLSGTKYMIRKGILVAQSSEISLTSNQ